MRRFFAFIFFMLGFVVSQSCHASVLDNADVQSVLANTSGLWKITFAGPQGESPVYMPCYSRYLGVSLSDDGSTATLKWNLTLDRKEDNEVIVRVYMDGDLPMWSISADIPADWIVDEVEFPIVKVEREEGVKAIIPQGYGVEYPISYEDVGLECRYPSVTGGMQFVMTHSPRGCYFLSSRDKTGAAKYFYVSGSKSTVTMRQRIVTSYDWTNDGHFELPWDTVFAFNENAWDKTLLEWYRPFVLTTKWGEKSIKERDIAPWILDADVWMRPKNMFPEVIESVRKAVKYYDKGMGIHWYHWHNYAYDTMYPEYLPAKHGFKEMVKEVQAAGDHVTPYINGRLWDPANDSYKSRNGFLASCRKKDGSLYTEIYPTSNVPNTVTCPSSPIWQSVIKELVDSVLNEIGTDGIYIDQVSCAASEPCYAENHPHAKGAGSWWPEAYRRLLTELQENMLGNKGVTSEENAEPYIDMLDMLLIVNTPHGKDVRMLPIFPLIYSDRAIYSGLNYYHQELNDGHFLYINSRSLLWGAQLGWVQPEWLFVPGCEREVEFLRTLGRFRARNHDVFYGGRFLGEMDFPEDLPMLSVFDGEQYPVVMGAKWLNVKGKMAYILVNMGSEEISVTLPDGKKTKLKAYSVLRK